MNLFSIDKSFEEPRDNLSHLSYGSVELYMKMNSILVKQYVFLRIIPVYHSLEYYTYVYLANDYFCFENSNSED